MKKDYPVRILDHIRNLNDNWMTGRIAAVAAIIAVVRQCVCTRHRVVVMDFSKYNFPVFVNSFRQKFCLGCIRKFAPKADI